MSATETDLNLNTYIGLSFPLRAGGNQDFQMTKTSLEQAQGFWALGKIVSCEFCFYLK